MQAAADALAAWMLGAGEDYSAHCSVGQARSCAPVTLAIVACLRVAMVPQGILNPINVPCR